MIKSKADIAIDLIIDDPRYEIREDGTIWTSWSRNGQGYLPDGDKRQFKSKTDGYYTVTYTFEDKTEAKVKVHRIIWRYFMDELTEGLVINHKNGIKTDNRPENLELITQAENSSHAIKILGHSCIKNFKINAEIASEIREKRKNGSKYSSLMKEYDLSKASISYVVNNKIWK